jgi:hypothetical protein
MLRLRRVSVCFVASFEEDPCMLLCLWESMASSYGLGIYHHVFFFLFDLI